CPCAFALTMPATLTRALGALARRGVLVTNAAALSALARVDQAWFDKTGTLSTPQFAPERCVPLRGDAPHQLLQWAAALARASSHPLARALAASTGGRTASVVAQAVQVTAGGGIAGLIEGRRLRLPCRQAPSRCRPRWRMALCWPTTTAPSRCSRLPSGHAPAPRTHSMPCGPRA